MTAAQLMGLMYSYGKHDDLGAVIQGATIEYIARFGTSPETVAVCPGTVIPDWIIGEIEVVERKFIRPGFILVGKFEKEESQDVRKMD